MKILVDIGHPAHIHYFKNLINILSKKDNQFMIVARDKEITLDLLNIYNYEYISRGSGGNTLFYSLR